MLLKVVNQKGSVAYVDNGGQVNGRVSVQGDPALVRHLNYHLNVDIDLPFDDMRALIDTRLLTENEHGMQVLYKASDAYLRDLFIPLECHAFGYSVEILGE